VAGTRTWVVNTATAVACVVAVMWRVVIDLAVAERAGEVSPDGMRRRPDWDVDGAVPGRIARLSVSKFDVLVRPRPGVNVTRRV
jgi:hypothetical protein